VACLLYAAAAGYAEPSLNASADSLSFRDEEEDEVLNGKKTSREKWEKIRRFVSGQVG